MLQTGVNTLWAGGLQHETNAIMDRETIEVKQQYRTQNSDN